MPPYILLSILLGITYGTIFHLWRGKTVRDLIIYILAGIIGFALGQGMANLMDFSMLLIGPLHIVEATVVSWASLFLVQWLKV